MGRYSGDRSTGSLSLSILHSFSVSRLDNGIRQDLKEICIVAGVTAPLSKPCTCLLPCILHQMTMNVLQSFIASSLGGESSGESGAVPRVVRAQSAHL